MWSKTRHNFVSRGCSALIALGVGLLAGGSLMPITYVIGGIIVLIGIVIFVYNWKNPTDDVILSISENAKRSKLIWGFWHTGENFKRSFKLGTIKKILILEPDSQSIAVNHLLDQADANKDDLLKSIHLTTNNAIRENVLIRWHNEQTASSFTIYDPSPMIENNGVVKFSKRAYVVVQLADRNLIPDDWTLYKITKEKDPYAFEKYVKYFKNVWDNKSKNAIPDEALNG